MQKVGIRHGKRGKAVETLINRAPSAGLVTGGRPFGGGRLDGWTLWEFTLPRYRDHRTLSAHCNFYQLKIQLATELPLRTFSLDHFSKHVWSSPQSIPNGLKWSVKSRQNPDKISGWVFLLPQLQTYQLCKDKTEKTKEKDREFLYEVKWKDLSPAENTFESVSRCPLLIVQPM